VLRLPAQLALGRIYAALYWNDAPPAWLSIESSRIHLEHALLDVPAAVVTQFVPAMRAAALGGELNLRSESLSLTAESIQGDVLVDWMQASSPLSSIHPLGNYHAQLSGNPDGLSILLNTLNGALILNGSGSWSGRQGLDFQGSAQADASKQKEMSELLRILGNEQVPGSGLFQISLKAQ
ncbi:MAG: type II secretion system protein N, partial [Methylophilaceae bacterium]